MPPKGWVNFSINEETAIKLGAASEKYHLSCSELIAIMAGNIDFFMIPNEEEIKKRISLIKDTINELKVSLKELERTSRRLA